MVKFEWTWKTLDRLDLYARGWAPEGRPAAVLCLVHGLGEHTGRYAHVGAALAAKGYALLGFDLRGHGRSGGPRGHTPSYEVLLDDIAAFLEQADERYPDLPRFLFGHSLGGNLVLNYGLRRKPDLHGVVSVGTWLKLVHNPPAVQVALGRMMNVIAPGFSQHSKLDAAGFSHDQAVVSTYRSDPLVHDFISARMFLSIHQAGLWALEHAAEFSLPLLLMHGAADPIVSAEACREFAQKAGGRVTFKLWDGMYHEIWNEPAQAEVFKTIIDRLVKSELQ